MLTESSASKIPVSAIIPVMAATVIDTDAYGLIDEVAHKMCVAVLHEDVSHTPKPMAAVSDETYILHASQNRRVSSSDDRPPAAYVPKVEPH
jgi:hypothetical protein